MIVAIVMSIKDRFYSFFIHDSRVETNFPGNIWTTFSRSNRTLALFAFFLSLRNSFICLTDIFCCFPRRFILSSILFVLLFQLYCLAIFFRILWWTSVRGETPFQNVSIAMFFWVQDLRSALKSFASSLRPHLNQLSRFPLIVVFLIASCSCWLGRLCGLLSLE